MKSPVQKSHSPSQTFASCFEALDIAQKEIVSQGLDVQAAFNSICAVEYLKSHNIDGDVIRHALLPRN